MNQTRYAKADDGLGFYKVTFRVNDSGAELTRSFDSAYLAECFVRKLKHSVKCTLLSYPLFYV